MQKKDNIIDDLANDQPEFETAEVPVNDTDPDDDDWEYDESEYITRDEFEDEIEELKLRCDVHSWYLDELKIKSDENPQQLVCESKATATEKTCIANYNLGLSPEYIINFIHGHKSKKPVRLCLAVQRVGGMPATHYTGIISEFPEELEPRTSVKILCFAENNGQIGFSYCGPVYDDCRTRMLIDGLMERVDALEKELSHLKGYPSASES